MKKILFIGSIVLFAFGCTQNETKKEDAMSGSKMSDSTSNEKVEYVYATESGGDWEPGNKQHAANVMKGLKAFESNNIAECITYFSDSVELRFDRFYAKLSNDSLGKFFAQSRNNMSSYTVKMEDWESVKSKDGSREYVSLWYKEIWTDKAGKTDSLSIMDDLLLKNGKITSLDQKIRHYPDSKKM